MLFKARREGGQTNPSIIWAKLHIYELVPINTLGMRKCSYAIRDFRYGSGLVCGVFSS